jgi:enoyl-CoA hydratase/carnithine racemase
MTENAGELVRLEVADGVGTIRLDRPKMNAISLQVQAELRAAAAEATERDDVKAVVVYGGERVFAAGNDVKEMADLGYADMVKLGGSVQAAVTAVARIPKPVVAAKRLSRLVGPSKAKDLIFTGRFVPADEALAMGLVDRVVTGESPAAVYDEALAWAQQFAGAATYALRAAKESIDRGLEVDLESGLEIERAQFAALFATADRVTGMRSFIENGPGKARFEGR